VRSCRRHRSSCRADGRVDAPSRTRLTRRRRPRAPDDPAHRDVPGHARGHAPAPRGVLARPEPRWASHPMSASPLVSRRRLTGRLGSPASHPHAKPAQPQPPLGPAAAIARRWPTWLAIAMAALLAPGGSVEGLASALPLVALAYLAAASLQRRQATWVVAVVAGRRARRAQVAGLGRSFGGRRHHRGRLRAVGRHRGTAGTVSGTHARNGRHGGLSLHWRWWRCPWTRKSAAMSWRRAGWAMPHRMPPISGPTGSWCDRLRSGAPSSTCFARSE